MEMCSDSQDEAYERQQCCDRVYDQDGRQAVPCRGWQRKVVRVVTSEEAICAMSATPSPNSRAIQDRASQSFTLTCAVSNLRSSAVVVPFTIAEYAKVPALERAQRNLFDDGRRDSAQQQEDKSDEEDNSQRSGRS